MMMLFRSLCRNRHELPSFSCTFDALESLHDLSLLGFKCFLIWMLYKTPGARVFSRLSKGPIKAKN